LSESEVFRLRQEFLSKRVERLQAETLIKETEAQDAIESGRRSQQVLDDWFRSKQFRAREETGRIRTFSNVGEEYEGVAKKT